MKQEVYDPKRSPRAKTSLLFAVFFTTPHQDFGTFWSNFSLFFTNTLYIFEQAFVGAGRKSRACGWGLSQAGLRAG